MGFLTSHQLGAGRKNILYGQWLDWPPLGGSYFFFTSSAFSMEDLCATDNEEPHSLLYASECNYFKCACPRTGDPTSVCLVKAAIVSPHFGWIFGPWPELNFGQHHVRALLFFVSCCKMCVFCVLNHKNTQGMTVGLVSRKNMGPVSYLYKWRGNERNAKYLRLWR